MWSYNEKPLLGVMKIKEYPRYTLYKVFRKAGKQYIPIYNTTLSKAELESMLKNGYELLDERIRYYEKT